MARNWMVYWNWGTVENELNAPLPLCFQAHSGQFGKVQPGDTLWIVSVPPRSAGDLHGQLILVGRLRVGFVTDDWDEAVLRLGTDDIWDAKWHIGAAPDTAEPYTLVSLVEEAADLRFVSEQVRLTLVEGKVNPQQLQTIRQLAPASVERLTLLWEIARMAEREREQALPDDDDDDDNRFIGPPMELVEDDDRLDSADPLPPDDLLFPEGRPILRQHLERERNPQLVQLAKQRFLEQHGRLFCEVCDFDFTAAYGRVGAGYIEAHHTVPVSQLREGDQTRVSDLAMVCANCHRMLHRSDPLLSVDALREQMKVARYARFIDDD